MRQSTGRRRRRRGRRPGHVNGRPLVHLVQLSLVLGVQVPDFRLELDVRFAGQRFVRPVHRVVRPPRVRGTRHRTGRGRQRRRRRRRRTATAAAAATTVRFFAGRPRRRRQVHRAQRHHRVAPLGRARRLVPQAQPAAAPVHPRHYAADAHQKRYDQARDESDRRPRAPRLVLDVTFI